MNFGIRGLGLLILVTALCWINSATAQSVGAPGDSARYVAAASGSLPSSTIHRLEFHWEQKMDEATWLHIEAVKQSGVSVHLWCLTDGYPSADQSVAELQIKRYIVQESDSPTLEYVEDGDGQTILPRHGYWPHLLPRAAEESERAHVFPPAIRFLGHRFVLESLGTRQPTSAPNAKRLQLPGNLEIGAKYTVRDTYQMRRHDDEPVPLTPYQPSDYPVRMAAGQTTFNVPPDHVDLVRFENVFYSGDDPKTAPFPELLYRSNYLGPNPDYLDEPGVRTAFALQRALADRPELGSSMSIETVMNRFKAEFQRSNYEARPTRLQTALAERPDVALGRMETLQRNIWSWEVLLSTAVYQLGAESQGPPSAIVYEGRITTDKDLPLFNAATGAQIPTHDQKARLDMLYGLMRGAARVTDKAWGMAIYGQHNPPEIYRALSYAYALGASYFLFWTSDRGHHVPYEEQLAYSTFIRSYARQHPDRDLQRLKRSAEVMILFPPGYTIGTREPMWWLPPLHYEKRNAHGLKIREIVSRVAAEIERCYRQGVAYDLAWEWPGIDLSDYREIVRVREDGRIIVDSDEEHATYNQPRWPARPAGRAPGLTVTLSHEGGRAPLFLVAHAEVTEFQAPVRFTPKRTADGVWQNTQVIWKLYGPGEHTYASLSNKYDHKSGLLPIELSEPGEYRLRAAVVDRAGRSTVRWKTIRVDPR